MAAALNQQRVPVVTRDHGTSSDYAMLRMLDRRLKSFAPNGVIHVSAKNGIANPAALGLLGFACTTAILQGSVTGISGVTTSSWAVAFGFFYGGLAQFIAGILEFFRQAMFPAVAFSTYGAFWMSFSIYSVLTRANGTGGQSVLAGSLNGEQMMLFIFAAITFAFWLCTFAMNLVLCALFFTLAWGFVFLGVGVDHHTWHQFGGWWLLVTAAIAFYAAAATLVNDSYNRVILPLGFFRKQEHLTDPDEPDMLEIPHHPQAFAKGGQQGNHNGDIEAGDDLETETTTTTTVAYNTAAVPVSTRTANVP